MDELERCIADLGGAASHRTLARLGFTRAQVSSAVARGDLLRVRDGWFAALNADADVIRAVRVGGTLTGASVARMLKLWTIDDDRLHVRVPRTASRLAAPGDRARPLDAARHRVCVHYSGAPGTDGCRDLPARALIEMFRCGTPRAALVALDSALNKGIIDLDTLGAMRAEIPHEKVWTFDQADAGAQSGLETLVRLLLKSRRVRLQTQKQIEPAGRVDILVGERLVLELDGEEFHTGAAFDEDRRRDFALTLQGYLVVRLSYRMIMFDWDRVADGILALVRRGEHLWRGRREHGPFAYAG
jgi:very-short-patch-repair endonuclease